MAVIAFHSLEDRIVKHGFAGLQGLCTCPPDFPECRCEPEKLVRVLTRSPIRPTDDEIRQQPEIAVGPVAGRRTKRGELRWIFPVVGPSNRFLVPQRDRRWPHVLSTFLLLAVLVVGALGLGRLAAAQDHLDPLRSHPPPGRGGSARVQGTGACRLELEYQRSPRVLALRAAELGLMPSEAAADVEIVATADGDVP